MRGEALAAVIAVAATAALALGSVATVTATVTQAEDPPVVGYVDTTDLGFTEAHYYEIHTPDGTIPCIVTESPEHGAGAGIDCDWTDKQ